MRGQDDIDGRVEHLSPTAGLEELLELALQSFRDPLVQRTGRRRHQELPVQNLIAVPIRRYCRVVRVVELLFQPIDHVYFTRPNVILIIIKKPLADGSTELSLSRNSSASARAVCKPNVDDEGQKVHARRDRVRGLALTLGIPGHARWPNANKASVLIAPEHVEPPPFGRRQGKVDSHRPKDHVDSGEQQFHLGLGEFPDALTQKGSVQSHNSRDIGDRRLGEAGGSPPAAGGCLARPPTSDCS